MGVRDLTNLFIIHTEIAKLNKLNDWNFNFRVDSGNLDTVIQIEDDGTWHSPRKESKGKILVPDLIDYSHKLIIEFEEEAGPDKGARKIKGHFPEILNPRDEERDTYYKLIKFDLMKIWKSDLKRGMWKQILLLWLQLHCTNMNYTKIPN